MTDVEKTPENFTKENFGMRGNNVQQDRNLQGMKLNHLTLCDANFFYTILYKYVGLASRRLH